MLGYQLLEASQPESSAVQAWLTEVDACLRGPTGDYRWEVVLPPGERINMPVFALDWRGRPVPGYPLRASLVAPPADDGPRVTLDPPLAATDKLGKVAFTLAAERDSRPGVVDIEVRDHGVFREAHARVHVRPFEVRLDPSLGDRAPLGPSC